MIQVTIRIFLLYLLGRGFAITSSNVCIIFSGDAYLVEQSVITFMYIDLVEQSLLMLLGMTAWWCKLSYYSHYNLEDSSLPCAMP